MGHPRREYNSIDSIQGTTPPKRSLDGAPGISPWLEEMSEFAVSRAKSRSFASLRMTKRKESWKVRSQECARHIVLELIDL